MECMLLDALDAGEEARAHDGMDDDMSDEDIGMGREAQSLAPPPACDDDMSSDEGMSNRLVEDEREISSSPVTMAELEFVPPHPSQGHLLSHPSPNLVVDPVEAKARSIPSRVVACRARIKELKSEKATHLANEDFVAAHNAQQCIKTLDQEIETMRLQVEAQSMPTPTRRRRMRLFAKGSGATVPIGSNSADGSVAASSSSNTPAAEDDTASKGNSLRKVPDWQTSTKAPGFMELAIEEGGSLSSSGRGAPKGDGPASTFRIPKEVFEKLYNYQREGVAWMARLWEQRQGGILADEMGLGKTVQICATLNGARRAGATHALLLMPVTLLEQWMQEARTWCPGWPVYAYYGSASQRATALRKVSRPEGGMLITSYSMLGNTESLFDVLVEEAISPQKKGSGKPPPKRRRLEKGAEERFGDNASISLEGVDGFEVPSEMLPKLGQRKQWDIVVCDEAHRMKNISTLLGKSLRRLRSRSRLLLTGTPVQNALQDLWALMDFAQPGLLGNHATFVKRFSDPIDRGSVRGADPFQAELKRHLSMQLRTMIAPHLLRRTKASTGLVGEQDEFDIELEEALAEEGESVESEAAAKMLPPKRETIVWLNPTDEQESAYRKLLEKSEVVREACDKTKMGIEVFRAIGLLKRLCNHPALLLPTPQPGQWRELLAEAEAAQPSKLDHDETMATSDVPMALDMASAGDASISAEVSPVDDARAGRAVELMLRKLPRNIESLLAQSAKLRCLSTMLPALIARGHRVLVFSHSVKMLDLVQICCLKPHNLRCLRIDGQTDPRMRNDKVRKFEVQRDRFHCMLLSTSVGGVGLNLTSADRVILVDPAWNPAVDAQAVDRAFRIGQEREVRVYRLIMSGLIEDKMFRLQVFKMGLTRTALEASQQQSYFTAREIRNLFEWTNPVEGETRRLLSVTGNSSLVDTENEADKIVALAAAQARDREEMMKAADDDGAVEEAMVAKGWSGEPVIGLSDFGSLMGGFSVEQGKETKTEIGEATQHLSKAREQLGAAEEKYQNRLVAREAAEAHVEATRKDLEEVQAGIEKSKERRQRAEEALKERKGKLNQARKALESATKILEKHGKAKGKHAQAVQISAQAQEAEALATRSCIDACAASRAGEDALSEALCTAELQLTSVNGSCGTDIVEVPKKLLKSAHTALAKVRAPLAEMAIRQAELECAYENLSQADAHLVEAQAAVAASNVALPDSETEKVYCAADAIARNAEAEQESAERERCIAEAAVEDTWARIMETIQEFVVEGVALSDAFQKVSTRNVRTEQVNSLKAVTKAAFKQLETSAKTVRKAREAWVKAATSKRKALQKKAAAMAAQEEAEQNLATAEHESQEALFVEETQRKELSTIEVEQATLEAERCSADMEEAEQRSLRDAMKIALPEAKEAVRAAKAAEKEALAERQYLQSLLSKAEQRQLRMEEAKKSAVETLKAETYNSKQVEMAYHIGKRKCTGLQESRELAAGASRSYEEACSTARASEERLSKAFADAEHLLGDEHLNPKTSCVTYSDEKLHAARTALERFRASLDTMAIRQAELECADEDLAQADTQYMEAELELASCTNACLTAALVTQCAETETTGRGKHGVAAHTAALMEEARVIKAKRTAERNFKSWEQERTKAEEDQGKAKECAESAWEEMAQVVQAFSEAGITFAETFQKAEIKSNPIRMEQVRAAMAATKSSFRQLVSSAQAVRKAREGWVKASAARRKAKNKEREVVIADAHIMCS